MKCKCGSFAINDDPAGVLCDRCWRDVEIARLRDVVRTLRLHARNIALDGNRLLAGFSWTAQQQAEAVAAFDAETERLVNGNND